MSHENANPATGDGGARQTVVRSQRNGNTNSHASSQTQAPALARRRRRPRPFIVFIDRPANPKGLPIKVPGTDRLARHVEEVWPRWWWQQCKRGWPDESRRAVGIIETISRPARSHPRAYSYISTGRALDSVSVIAAMTTRHDEPAAGVAR